MKRRFSFLGLDFCYTHPFDRVVRYTTGARYYINGELDRNTEEYWHKVFIGLYVRKDTW
jgi:hypothetical protein